MREASIGPGKEVARCRLRRQRRGPQSDRHESAHGNGQHHLRRQRPGRPGLPDARPWPPQRRSHDRRARARHPGPARARGQGGPGRMPALFRAPTSGLPCCCRRRRAMVPAAARVRRALACRLFADILHRHGTRRRPSANHTATTSGGMDVAVSMKRCQFLEAAGWPRARRRCCHGQAAPRRTLGRGGLEALARDPKGPAAATQR